MQQTNIHMSSCKGSVRVLSFPLSFTKEEKLLYFIKPGQQPAGMTANLTGFTLIELLVVVLIIGILAAVALPQYRKVVWKSRNTQLKTIASAVNQAQQSHRLASGTFTTDFENLSIDLPLTPNLGINCGMESYNDSGRKGKNFEAQLYPKIPVIIWWTSGPYKCAGFAYDPNGKMWCIERYVHFTGTAGSFCTQVENATLSQEITSLYRPEFGSRFYTLP